MTNSFTLVSLAFLIILAIPAVLLTWGLRPRPFRYVLRGGEYGLACAISLDSIRRIVLLEHGSGIAYPGPFLAVVTIVTFAVGDLLVWTRYAQFRRHKAKTRQMKESARDLAKRYEPNES